MWKPRVAVAGHLHVQVVSVEVTVAIIINSTIASLDSNGLYFMP